MPDAGAAIITDTSASLPADASCLPRVLVVPLRLLAGGAVADDDGGGAALAASARGERVTTARPTPDRFAQAYRAAAAAGFTAAVCVHLSGLLSGTAESALVAARDSAIPVRVVDSGTIGAGLGLTVLEAARFAQDGAGPDEIAAAAARFAAETGTFLALDGFGALLASGRAPAAPAGEPAASRPGTGDPGTGDAGSGDPGSGDPGSGRAALVSRPILRIAGGRLVPVERVRTRAAAAGRLADLAAGFAGDDRVDVAVEHTADAGRAASLAARLGAVIPQVRRQYLMAAGGAIVANVGPRMVGVTVAPAREAR